MPIFLYFTTITMIAHMCVSLIYQHNIPAVYRPVQEHSEAVLVRKIKTEPFDSAFTKILKVTQF